MMRVQRAVSTCIVLALISPVFPQVETEQKYQITILEGASRFRRAKKGRASSQAVIRITDRNDTPVAGIAVTFTLPQFVGGAAFTNGGLTAVAVTNTAGVASAGVTVSGAASAFNIGVAATVPGQVLTASIPVNAAAAAAAAGASGGAGAGAAAGGGAAGTGAGVSSAVVGAIVAGAAAAAIGVGVAVAGGGEETRPRDRVRISLGGPAQVGNPQ